MSFEPYVVSYLVAETAALLYCCAHATFLFNEKPEDLRTSVISARASVRCGIKLMVANLASSLILGIVRFAVDFSWGIETFGELSFALSLVNFFLVFVSQVSMVLFPALRKVHHETMRTVFVQGRCLLGCLLPWAFVLYFPACYVLSLWLPQYHNSLYYFALLLPVCLFDGKMNLLGTTFMKVMRKESYLLRINFVSVGASVFLVLLNLLFLHSVNAMILGVAMVIVVRSIVSEKFVGKMLGMPLSKKTFWDCLLVTVFLLTIYFEITLLGVVVLVTLCCCCSLANLLELNRIRAQTKGKTE